ncbi:MAG TPA: thiamine pyrophosphate-binding protein, partial [Solirubrobacterales bacterium]|nr:thiamine pyrophosphate-binding protein [Solirubrobacterales bacterium]
MAEHGGRLVAKALKSRGVEHLFTLSGGHLFSIYDGCKEEGIGLVDVRHEQTAVFAAEGIAKATRGVGVAALTAGPGVTNGLSAIAGAQANFSPVCVLGGRAPELRWGSGSLQEIDHLPFVSPLVKSAETVKDPARIVAVTAAALDLAAQAPSGPTFVDYPLDVVFTEAEVDVPALPEAPDSAPAAGLEEAAALLAAAGVSKLFTLSGGHLFSIYDGCRDEGIDIVDVRHESAAAFAAEGWAKVTRRPGVAALTAGPGVTNGVSAIAGAQANGSPVCILGGRAPELRWG